MFIIKLGLKNLTRQKKRSMTTIFIMGLAFFVYLFIGSLMDGVGQMTYNNIINYQTAHIQIAHPTYWQDKDKLSLENLMVLSPQIRNDIVQTEDVIATSAELRFQASLNNGIDEVPVMGMGISTDAYNQVFATSEHLIAGTMFSPGEDKAVLGVKLAELMDLGVNDYLTLLVRTKDETFNTMELEVSGLLRAPNPLINNGIVFVPLDVAQEVLEVGDGIGMMAVKIKKQEEIDPVIADIDQIFQEKNMNNKAYSWQETKLAKTNMLMKTAGDAESIIILMIILTIGIIGIINNVVLSAMERSGEIGMMKALGMREWEIVSVFMVEAGGIGVLGGLAGCILGYFGVGYLVKYGWDLGMYGGDFSSFDIPIADTLYGEWNLSSFVFIFFFGIIVALFSSMIPAYRAARKDPVKAIYHHE